MTGPLALEGGIAIRLSRVGRTIRDVGIRSTRPIPVESPFRNRKPEEVLQLLPLVYAICGTAQTTATLRGLESAQGLSVAPVQERARELLVLAENAREHWASITREHHEWLGAVNSGQRRAEVYSWPERLRLLLYPEGDWSVPGGGRLEPDSAGLHDFVGGVARAVNDLVSPSLPSSRVSGQPRGGTAMAGRSLSCLTDLLEERRVCGFGAGPFAPLPDVSGSWWQHRLAADDDATFRRYPEREGEKCETGPLSRQYRNPLVAAALARFGAGIGARQLARLVELTEIPHRMTELMETLTTKDSCPKSEERSSGTGVGVVEAARGRLVHWVAIDGGRVTGHRIVAPTEWNFHPRGPLVEGLRGAVIPEGLDVEGAAGALVRALDPCVGYTIEVDDA